MGDFILRLHRVCRNGHRTIGQFWADGEYVCDCLEDVDRGLTDDMDEAEISRIKVRGETAIPAGTYEIDLDTTSPKFGGRKQYAFCSGKLPRLMNVKGYSGILIHSGNYESETEGCLLTGEYHKSGMVINSLDNLKKLYAILRKKKDEGKRLYITID